VRKIWSTLLEALGFSKVEADTFTDLLAKHLTLEVFLTLIILALTVALPILISRPLADRFDRNAKTKDRQERVEDITLAAYHEIFLAWIAMIEAFGIPDMAEAIVKRIQSEVTYFPLYTFDPSEPTVFENYVKKDIAIFPTELIRATISYYDSLQFFTAYLVDSRTDRVAGLTESRKIAFVRDLYSTAYQHMATGCASLIAYEDYVEKLREKRSRWKLRMSWRCFERCRPDFLLDLSLLAKAELFSTHAPASTVLLDIEERKNIYRN